MRKKSAADRVCSQCAEPRQLASPDLERGRHRRWREQNARPPARQLTHYHLIERLRHPGSREEERMLGGEDKRNRGPEAETIEQEPTDPDQISEPRWTDIT